MGYLVQASTGQRIRLKSHNRVGRIGDAEIVLMHRKSSQNHAAIRWGTKGWELMDLGSRNGTSVDREKIPSAAPLLLRRGMFLAFGAPDELWRFENDAPPLASATRVETGEEIIATGDFLCLDAGEERVASVYRQPSGHWVVDRDGELLPARENDTLIVGDQTWRLVLPNTNTPTELDESEPTIENLRLLFQVSRDEEDVTVIATLGHGEANLGSHAHHYPLLILARQRLADGQDPALGESEHGWMGATELAEQLRVDATRLNVDVYRARRQLAQVGVVGAQRLVERRPQGQKLRLGVARFAIEQG